MTKRNPVSAPQNIWFDAQQVDDTDLTLEQNYNNGTQSGIINNQVGDGILAENLQQPILFDSSLVTGFLDGLPINTQNQPSDNNLGNQLEITLSGSLAASKKTIKICVIGLDFQSNLQYEIFYFRVNEIQSSRRHFTKILVILFNDFIGDPNYSLNLSGRVIITETAPLTVSRSPIMAAQDVQPNLFARDFFADGFLSLDSLLQAALPLYNVESLTFATEALDTQVIYSRDVTTQVGEKFLASTDSIQKISLLMAVQNTIAGQNSDLVWNGDLIVSIYPLQSTIVYSSDIVPNLAIDFSPYNIPLAQISFNYASLQSSGTILSSVFQPVDFVFSNSPIAGGNLLTPGTYYAFTVKRAGAANKCDILIATGANVSTDSRITIFNGTLWVDITDQDLWFRVWTDAAKVSDGQYYENGHGALIPKTTQDSTTLTVIDNVVENLQFVGNDIYHVVASTTIDESVSVPDQRTGNPVLTRQQTIPSIELLNTIDTTNLKQTSEPLVIGAITDKNRKFYDSISSTINSVLHSATMVKDELIIRVVDDPTDTIRFDSSISGLITNLLNGDFASAQIVPDIGQPGLFYRIASAKLVSSILGDVNGDGIIDERDLNLLNTFVGFNMNVGLPANTILNTDGYHTTFTNGYTTATQGFAGLFNINFQLVDSSSNAVIANGSDGILVPNPSNTSQAQFTSANVVFNNIIGLFNLVLILNVPTTLADYGGFQITALDALTDVLSIKKTIITGDVLMQMLRADIDGDFQITATDGYLLQNYIQRNNLTLSPSATFPGPSTNPFTKIGTRFNTIRLKLEQFVDRDDDYSSLTVGRPNVVHSAPDLFLADGYFYQHNFYLSPVSFSVQKQLTWYDTLIVTNSQPRLVPTVFTSLLGFTQNACTNTGINNTAYEEAPTFDPGLVDVFTPNNIILGQGGELHRPDGSFYKVDFEVGTIILEIPDGLFGSERTINIMDDFIADYTGDGRTRLGFPSMRFADCSLVSSVALTDDQLRFSVAVQSFSPNTNGMSSDGETGAIVDGKMGVAIDYKTGLLTLNFTNLFQDPILKTLNTKIQIHVFLKKGGFNNSPIFIDSAKMNNMLKLVSVFSGVVDGGPSALVNLQADVTGVLPIIHGGTGLNDVGVTGMVLASNGSGLSYQFVTDIIDAKPFSLGIPSAGVIPQTDGYGLLDPSFYYKNPIFITAFAGTPKSVTTTSPTTISSFSFRFDSFILESLQSITLEAIVSVATGANAEIRLFNQDNNVYINLNGASQQIVSASTNPILIRSGDIKSLLITGAHDFIYFVQLDTTNTSDAAVCYLARLVLTYANPISGTLLTHSYNFGPNPIFPDVPS